jgi:hypothetical protein
MQKRRCTAASFRFDLIAHSRYGAWQERPTAPNGTKRWDESRVDTMNGQSTKRSGWSWWYLLLVVQFLFLLCVPSYNRLEPTLIGLPFFYWYQLLWVIVSGVLTAIVYFATED